MPPLRTIPPFFATNPRRVRIAARVVQWSLWLLVALAFSGFVKLGKDALAPTDRDRFNALQATAAQWDSTVRRDSLALVAFEDTVRDTILARVAALPGSLPWPSAADKDTALEHIYLNSQRDVIFRAGGSLEDFADWMKAIGYQIPPEEMAHAASVTTTGRGSLFVSPALVAERAAHVARLTASQAKRHEAGYALGAWTATHR